MKSHRFLASLAASTLLASTVASQMVFPVPAPSGSDDAPAIQAVLDSAEAWLVANPNAGAAIVNFQSKVYTLKSYPDLGPFTLQVRGMTTNTDQMILAGNGATLLHGLKEGQTLGIRTSNKVVIQDLTFDRTPRPFMEGTVQSVTGLDIDIKFLRGLKPDQFPSSITNRWGWLLDPSIPGRPKDGTRPHHRFTSVQPIGNDVYTFALDPNFGPVSEFAVGDRFTYHYREGGNAIQIRNSDDTIIRNVKCYAAGSMFVNAEGCSGLEIDQCQALIPSGWWRSLNGDGFHIKCSDDITITGNFLEGLSDDGINLTAVDNFTVTNNLFSNKLRHAILLDANDSINCPADNSTNGLIRWNGAHDNGGSFIAHDGGDYATVTIIDNNAATNNLTRGGTNNRRIRLLSSLNSSLAMRADAGTNGTWEPSDTVYLDSVAGGGEFEWHLQDRLDNAEHLFIQRAARDQNIWLYLASSAATPTTGTPAGMGAPLPSSNPGQQKWRVEEVTGPTVIRVYLEGTTPKLYLSAATSGAPTIGTTLELRPLNAVDRNQVWVLDLVED
ncbi:MAG: right-handed parallel beta-helix repeat-containing protein [Planctomycetota bacterium]